MEFLLTAVIIILISGFLGLFWYLKNQNSKPKDDQSSVLLLQNQLHEITRRLDSSKGEMTDIMQRQYGDSAKIIRDVTERLTKLDETNRQVVNFADQLKSLQ